jgi:hypothetical protein
VASYGASFLLGLLAGRKIFAREERVEPRVMYLPPAELSGADVREVFVRSLVEAGVPREVAEEVYRRVLENPKVVEYVELVRRRELAVEMLELANRALEEGRISTATYQQIAYRYMRMLAEAELRLEEAEQAARREVERIFAPPSARPPSPPAP